MARILIIALLLVFGGPAYAARAGALVMIGGGRTPAAAVREFIAAAGGEDAPILVMAQTQQDAAAGGVRSAAFLREQGARRVEVVGDRPAAETITQLRAASGVWIPGGDQNRFMETFPESSGIPGAIRALFRRGGAVGGTSAGASLMGSEMPAGAEVEPPGIREGASPLRPALGLLPGTVVDQHFLTRRRLQRLVSAVLERPRTVGIGMDEDAWAVLRDRTLIVRQGQVTVIRAEGKVRREEMAPQAPGEAPQRLLGAERLLIRILLPRERTRLPSRRSPADLPTLRSNEGSPPIAVVHRYSDVPMTAGPHSAGNPSTSNCTAISGSSTIPTLWF